MPLQPYPADLDLKVQSVAIPGSARPGYSAIYKSNAFDRSVLFKNQPNTLFELFEQSVARHPEQALFLRRPLVPARPPVAVETPVYGDVLIPTTYAAVQARRTNLGSALLALERSKRLGDAPEITHPGVPSYGSSRVKNGARRGWGVGIWSKNTEEWQVVDLATQAYGLVSISLYETLGPDVARYITNHCSLPIIFATPNHLPALLKLAPTCPSLRILVSMDPIPRAQREVLTSWATSVNVELLDMLELETWGSESGNRCDPGPVRGVPGEDELDRTRIVTVSYTSGTTGDPKGVVLTNHNMTKGAISNAFGSSNNLNTVEGFIYLSYLPLAHIYERFLYIVVIFADGTIGLTTGDTTKLLEDAQLIKPHMMAGVPRVYNRIYAAIKMQMDAGGLKGNLLTRAVNTKLANMRATGQITHSIYDALVFRKVRALLGGNLRYMSAGGAPLLPEVQELLTVCLSCDFVQGSGMTETVGTASKGIPWDRTAIGTCGAIQPVNDVKLMDVPEMGYTASDSPNPRGEILFKGENVFAGYLYDEVNTRKALDEDGWLHTGDVGEMDQLGRLKIIDRVKNVIKLAQGEYVALEKLEGIYALDPLFATLLVHGDSTRSSLVAIAVLDPIKAAALVNKVMGSNLAPADIALLEEGVQAKAVRKAVVDNLAKVGRLNKLNGFEMIKGVHLTMTPFPDDIVTPTFKIKRSKAAAKFKQEIDEAYREADGGAKL